MKTFYVFLLGFICSCSPHAKKSVITKYPPLGSKEEIIVLKLSESQPLNATEIGEVKINDSGYSGNCTYDRVIEKAKKEARKMGGKIVKIVSHTPPNPLTSSCHQIVAKVLIVEKNILEYDKIEVQPQVNSNLNYAKVFVYRPSGEGKLISYNLFLGDSIICMVKPEFKKEIKINKLGKTTLSATIKDFKQVIPIEIENGKEYYIRCRIENGKPQIQITDHSQGKVEYDYLKSK